jgi:hypothetical protein
VLSYVPISALLRTTTYVAVGTNNDQEARKIPMIVKVTRDIEGHSAYFGIGFKARIVFTIWRWKLGKVLLESW